MKCVNVYVVCLGGVGISVYYGCGHNNYYVCMHQSSQ